MIKIRFVTGSSLVSKGIRTFTWSPYSHVEFEIEPGYFKDYPEGGYLGALGHGGVQVRPFDYDKEMTQQLFGVIDCDEKTSKSVLQYAYDQIGRPYDYAAIFDLVIHRDILDDHKWFCSELVAAAFLQADYPLLNISRCNRVTPGMLLLSPLIHYKAGFPLHLRDV